MPTASTKAPPNVAAAPSSALQTKSGIAYEVLTPGSGDALPTQDDTVTYQNIEMRQKRIETLEVEMSDLMDPDTISGTNVAVNCAGARAVDERRRYIPR